MAGEWFLVHLAGVWLLIYKLPLDTIKGAFLGHSGIKNDRCLSLKKKENTFMVGDHHKLTYCIT